MLKNFSIYCVSYRMYTSHYKNRRPYPIGREFLLFFCLRLYSSKPQTRPSRPLELVQHTRDVARERLLGLLCTLAFCSEREPRGCRPTQVRVYSFIRGWCEAQSTHEWFLTDDRRKRVSLSPPLHITPSWDEDALYQRLLETAGIKDVTDHVASIGATRKSYSELLVIDRVLGPMLTPTRNGMVSRLLAGISEMETAEKRLRQGKVKAQKLWRALDPSVSPISKLPDELLTIIFEHGAAQEIVELLQHDSSDLDDARTMVEAALADSTRSTISFSLLISHVCSNWRNLAIEKSTLWTRIRPFWRVEQIHAWLERCKTQLIHIDMLDASEPIGDEIFDLLRSHLHRCVSVSIHIRSVFLSDGSEEDLMHDYGELLFDARDGVKPLPELKHLSISSAVPVWFPSHLHGSEASAQILPRLEKLRFQRASTDHLDEFFGRVVHAQVDLSGLFSWNWSGIGVAQRLQRLTIRSPLTAPDQENELEEPFARWSLPTLRHLCIDWTPSGVCSSLLTLLRAPRLESLHVNLRGKDRRARRALIDFVCLNIFLYRACSLIFYVLCRLRRIPL